MRNIRGIAVAVGTLLAVVSCAPAIEVAYAPAPIKADPLCPVWGASTIAALPSLSDMRSAVWARYSRAVEESESDRTVYNRSPRLEWAYAARAACGAAYGYLSSGEVNSERLWNCECYSNRMESFARGPGISIRERLRRSPRGPPISALN